MMAGRTATCLFLVALGLCTICQATFFEDFGSKWDSRWIHSSDDKYTGRFVVETPEGLETPALKVPAKAKHYGLTTKLDEEVDPAKGLVLQYELKLSDGLTCGGAYLKYLTATPDFKAADLKDDTAYTIMFGPDKCGSTNKVHFILRHKAPSGEIEEKHLQIPPMVELDKGTHVYTAILNPEDNTYEILIDGEEKKAGSLFEDFQPPINPPEQIDDPEDKKPDTWVDTARIPDPAATKPEDWDEDAPATIPDPDAVKPEGWLDDEPSEIDDPEASQPEDWDEEEDGEWEPPRVPNPKCSEGPGCGAWKRPTKSNPAFKGKWSAPLIDNPEYKGPWAPRKIPNPAHFKDDTPLANLGKIGAAAIEIWTMDEGYFFSNILISSDPAAAEAKRDQLWKPKKELEEKLKAAEEKAAAEKAESAALDEPAAGGAKTLGGRIAALFDAGPLAAAKPALQPVLDFVEDNEWAALGLVLALPALAAFLLLPKLLGGKKKQAVPVATVTTTTAAVKKEDAPVPDDPTASAEVTAAAADEDAEGEGKVRRRVRRET